MIGSFSHFSYGCTLLYDSVPDCVGLEVGDRNKTKGIDIDIGSKVFKIVG